MEMPNPNKEKEKLDKALEASRAVEKSAEDAEYARFQQRKLAEKLGLSPDATTEEIDAVIEKRGLVREALEKGAIPEPEKDDASIDSIEGTDSPARGEVPGTVKEELAKEEPEKTMTPDFTQEPEKPKKEKEEPTVDIDIIEGTEDMESPSGKVPDAVKEEIAKEPKLVKPKETPKPEESEGKEIPEGQRQSTLGEFLSPEQRKEELAKKVESGGAIKEPTAEKPKAKADEDIEAKLEGELSDETRKAISERLAQFPNKEALRRNFFDVIKEITGDEQITLYGLYKQIKDGEVLDIPDSLLNPEKPKTTEGESAKPEDEKGEKDAEDKEGKEGEKKDEKADSKTETAKKETTEKPAGTQRQEQPATQRAVSLKEIWDNRAKKASEYSDWLESGIDTQVEEFKKVPDTTKKEYFKNLRRDHIEHIKWLKQQAKLAKRKKDMPSYRQYKSRIREEEKSFREFTKGSLNEGLVKRRWILNPFRKINLWLFSRRPMTSAEARIGAQIEQELQGVTGRPSGPEAAVMAPKTFFAMGLKDNPMELIDAFTRDQAKALNMPNTEDMKTEDLTRQVSDALEATEKAKAAAEGAAAPKIENPAK